MGSAWPDDFVLLGKVTRAHGIRGEIKVYPYSGDPQWFVTNYSQLLLFAAVNMDPVTYTVEHARVQGKHVLLKLVGCQDRNHAEMLVGLEVYVQDGDLPDPGEEEFYLRDLVGKNIVDIDGAPLGQGTRIMETGAHNILVIERSGKEYLVPVVGEFIVAIKEDSVILELPPGLLEINE